MGLRKLLLRPVELVRGGIAFGDGKFSDIIISKRGIEPGLPETNGQKGLKGVDSQRGDSLNYRQRAQEFCLKGTEWGIVA